MIAYETATSSAMCPLTTEDISVCVSGGIMLGSAPSWICGVRQRARGVSGCVVCTREMWRTRRKKDRTDEIVQMRPTRLGC